MNDINERAPKAEIISAAVEAIDFYANQNNRMKQQQKFLFGLTGLLLITHFL